MGCLARLPTGVHLSLSLNFFVTSDTHRYITTLHCVTKMSRRCPPFSKKIQILITCVDPRSEFGRLLWALVEYWPCPRLTRFSIYSDSSHIWYTWSLFFCRTYAKCALESSFDRGTLQSHSYIYFFSNFRYFSFIRFSHVLQKSPHDSLQKKYAHFL